MEKKKKIVLIVIISLLIILVLGLSGYIIWDNFLNKKDNGNINTTTTASIKENIIHTDTFTYNINNKNKEVKFVYIKESGDEFNQNFNTEEDINSAKENDEYVYNVIYLRIYVDDVEVGAEKRLIYINTKSEKDKFTNYSYKKTDIFKFNGEDKEYFAFVTSEPNQYVGPLTIPIIFNDEGKLLYKIHFPENFGIYVVDKKSRFYHNNEMFLIEKDAVYFIELVCGFKYNSNADEDDIYNNVIQERILTVDNDVINIAPGKLYKGGGGGALPWYCPEENN